MLVTVGGGNLAPAHMSYSLNFLKGLYRLYIDDYYRVIKEDTRSLDCSSCTTLDSKSYTE